MTAHPWNRAKNGERWQWSTFSSRYISGYIYFLFARKWFHSFHMKVINFAKICIGALQVNKLKLCKNLIRAVDGPAFPDFERYPHADRVTYKVNHFFSAHFFNYFTSPLLALQTASSSIVAA
jgi:hypothetical protein